MTRGKLSKNTVLVWPFNFWCADKKYRGIKLNCSSSTAQSKAPSQLNFCGSKRSGSGDDFCLLRDSAFLVIVLPVWVAGSVSAHFQVVSLMCFLCCFFVVVYGFFVFRFFKFSNIGSTALRTGRCSFPSARKQVCCRRENQECSCRVFVAVLVPGICHEHLFCWDGTSTGR